MLYHTMIQFPTSKVNELTPKVKFIFNVIYSLLIIWISVTVVLSLSILTTLCQLARMYYYFNTSPNFFF